MLGRDLTLAHSTSGRPWRLRSLLAISVTALAILAVGIVIGIRLGDKKESSTGPAQPALHDAQTSSASSKRGSGPPVERSEAGAASAAADAVTAFDGTVLLDTGALRTAVDRIASSGSRASLLEAFKQAGARLRDQLGADTVPKPVVLLRTFAIGYRVERYSPDRATVAVWNVGVVGSGATVQPQQSWRTQRVSLVWEHGAWKVAGFESERGPTPPLTNAEAADGAAELFTRIPQFEGFRRATP